MPRRRKRYRGKMKISHSFKKESLWEKTKWFMRLSLKDRYRISYGMAELHGVLHKGIKENDRRTFKTVQVLKKRSS